MVDGHTGRKRRKVVTRRAPEPETSVNDSAKWRDYPELLGRIFRNRGICDTAELRYPLKGLLRPEGFRDGQAATDLLCSAITGDQHIVIVGDYDVDGATATALGVRVLARFGASRVSYIVPDRFRYGYGLSQEIVGEVLGLAPDLVVTVDNGISSIDGVAALKKHGKGVLITDHHLPGPDLPDADAIINPNQRGCKFPGRNLSGIGVLFYLLSMVREQLVAGNWFAERGLAVPNLARYLDLVALGTVADMVPLDYNNRILVSHGIHRIRSGQCCRGILALLEVAGRDHERVIASDLGFAVAPRLNAAGRLEDISAGIECLLTDEGEEARKYATVLNEINTRRKSIESEMQAQALEIAMEVQDERNLTEDRAAVRKGFCLYDSTWHLGVTGLVASRIREKTGQPAIVFADAGADTLTGSARSVPGLHIRDFLELLAVHDPELIIRFGGHAMAAGLTIERNRLESLRQKFGELVSMHFQTHGSPDSIVTDGSLAERDLTLENAQEIREAAPWGQGFPTPTFHGCFRVLKCKVVGKNHLKLELSLNGHGKPVDAIAFRALETGQAVPQMEWIEAVYQLDCNVFRGKTSLQVLVEHFWAGDPPH